MYRGRLKDGSLVAIRCLKLKKSHSSQNFNRHIELISKLRYHHLVSALGHCFEYYLDDSTVSRLFLIFEYVSNGTLISNISGNWIDLPIIMAQLPALTFWVIYELCSFYIIPRGSWWTETYMDTENSCCHWSGKGPPIFACWDNTWLVWKWSENNKYTPWSEPCCKNQQL